MTNTPLRVCARCLAAIESREGSQYAHKIDLNWCDDDDTCDFVCEWCGDDSTDILYEI